MMIWINKTLFGKKEEFNKEILQKINFSKLMEHKNIIKKINSKNTITYKPKKLSRSLIDDLNLQVDLTYGRLNYKKDFLLAKNFFELSELLKSCDIGTSTVVLHKNLINQNIKFASLSTKV